MSLDLSNLKSNCVLVLAGPTAVGKTALAFELVKFLKEKNYEAVLINADALAVYQDMVIGTAAPSSIELEPYEHFLYNIHSPETEYNVHLFREEVFQILTQVFQKSRRIAILVGGSHQYLSSFIENIKYCELKTDLDLRLRLQQEYQKDREAFCKKVEAIDPEFAQAISPFDEKRFVRAAELIALTGYGPTYHKALSKAEPSPWNIFSFYLDDERSKVYERINQRVYKMLEDGFIEEVKQLLNHYPKLSKTALSAIGYQEVIAFLQDDVNEAEMIEKIQLRSRHLAKRQLTWLRNKTYFKAYHLAEQDRLKEDISNFLKTLEAA